MSNFSVLSSALWRVETLPLLSVGFYRTPQFPNLWAQSYFSVSPAPKQCHHRTILEALCLLLTPCWEHSFVLSRYNTSNRHPVWTGWPLVDNSAWGNVQGCFSFSGFSFLRTHNLHCTQAPLLLSISFLALLHLRPPCFLACFSANGTFFFISCSLMNEFHSSFSVLPPLFFGGEGAVGWSVNSYRLCLLPFFHLAIQFHGDRKWRGAAGWEAPGSEVKSGHLLN